MRAEEVERIQALARAHAERDIRVAEAIGVDPRSISSKEKALRAVSISCPACGGGGDTAYGSEDFETRGQWQGNPVRKCLSCGAGLTLHKGVFRVKTRLIEPKLWERMEVEWLTNGPGKRDRAASMSEPLRNYEDWNARIRNDESGKAASTTELLRNEDWKAGVRDYEEWKAQNTHLQASWTGGAVGALLACVYCSVPVYLVIAAFAGGVTVVPDSKEELVVLGILMAVLGIPIFRAARRPS